LLVRTAIVDDLAPDNGETFRLLATNTGGAVAAGTATIRDDSGGDIFKNDGTTDLITVKDDDRVLTVSSPSVNEGSSHVVFEVSGGSGQLTSLALGAGLASPAAGSGVDYGAASGSGLEYSRDSGVTWQTYTSGRVALNGSGKLLVRTAIVDDLAPDNGETFQLVATRTGGTTAAGTATIQDDGTGDIFRSDGTTDSVTVKNDDRVLTVTNPNVNEGSPYAVFEISGAAGQLTNLALGSGLTSPATASGVDYSTASGSGLEYSSNSGATWQTYASGLVALNGSGKLLVRTAIVDDSTPDSGETFQLIATNTGGTAAAGTATIRDDATGELFKNDGTTDSVAVKGDDRVLTVSNPSVNEGSPYAVFEISGAAGQLARLALGAGLSNSATGSGIDYGAAGGSGIQYFDGATWQAYTSGNVALNGSGKLLVRTAIVDDLAPDTAETFQLLATNTGGTTAAGTATIRDDATGELFKNDGTTDSVTVKNDDRVLTVTNPSVNEGSPYAVFEISGASGQLTSLALGAGLASPATGSGVDYSAASGSGLEYSSNSGATWQVYTSGLVALNGSGKLLVRTAIVDDLAPDNGETFRLLATNTGGTAAAGTATIRDDATGDIFKNDGTTDSVTVKNDDRVLTVTNPSVNEGSPYAVFEISGVSGQLTRLALGAGITSPATGAGVDYGAASGSGLEYSGDSGATWQAYTSGLVALNGSGKLLVRTALVDDLAPDNRETFQLLATNTGGTTAAGTATVRDDGAGELFKSDGTTDSVTVKNDDRVLTVTNPSVNEGSTHAMFEVSGAAGQWTSLALSSGLSNSAAGSGVDYSTASGSGLQYSSNSGATWQTYTSGLVALNGSGKLLVRTAIWDDVVPETAETFRVIATNTGGTTGTGTATIRDNATGDIFKDDGTTDSSVVKDDDRVLTVSSPSVNEGSPYAVFEISGAAGQLTSLALGEGVTNSATGAGVDYGAASGSGLQYFDGTTWQAYTSGLVALNGSGKLLVRTAIVSDLALDTGEAFRLIATNTGRTSFEGTATIKDDATGDIFKNDGTTDSSVVKDDDRELTVSDPVVNEASPYVVFEVSGAGGQLTSLALGAGSTNSAGGSGVDYGAASGTGLEYLDGTTWRVYTGGLVALDGSGKLLVRTAIVNDAAGDTGETFQLIATNTGGKGGAETATIRDDGTGVIFRNDGTVDTDAVNDDDRILAVTSPVVNEGSPYAFFTVTGGEGQLAKLSLSSGTATLADFGPGMEVSTDNGATWAAYVSDSRVALNGKGQLLVRTRVVSDNSLEYSEDLNLTAVNTGGITTEVTAQIVDDGSGTLFRADGSEDTSTLKDDDRPKPLEPAAGGKPPAKVSESVMPQPEPSKEPVVQVAQFVPPTSDMAARLIPVRDIIPLIGDILTSNLGFRTVVNESAAAGLNVYRGVTDQFVDGSDSAKVTIPADAFIHSVQEAVVKVEAKQVDNTSLPSWVVFDSKTGTFDVNAPPEFKGKLDIKVTARDDQGREAAVIFRIFVGKQPEGQKPAEKPAGKPQGRNSLSEKLRMAVKRNPGSVKGAFLPVSVGGLIVEASNTSGPFGVIDAPSEGRLSDVR